nr:major histocompatibility complex class I-related gene protein-like isoform X2 [Geotrypetes seraphini]XP_033781256.1 major histocompatibility complex class I-related gene protein-like isoform X2 [Geotrypetes seraphini]
MVNDYCIGFYSSDTRKITILHDWIWDAVGPEYVLKKAKDSKNYYEQSMEVREICIQLFNHTIGVHTLQVQVSCEMRGDTAIRGLFQYLYDGQVFVTYDAETGTWIAAVTEAIPLKQFMDTKIMWLAYVKSYHETECIENLKKFIQHGKHVLEQKVPPEVRVLIRHSTDGADILRCHVTGFYPRDIDVTWVRDGWTTMVETWSSGILPNHDKTYQIRKTLEIDPKDGHTYACVVNHSSLQKPIEKTASVSTGSWILGLSAAGITILFLLGLGLAGFLIWKKKQNLNADEKKDRAPLSASNSR